MAIVVTLYTYTGDDRVVNKSLGTGVAYNNCIFKDSAELHSPVFTVEADVSASVNYCSITDHNGKTRYYYATVINLRTGLSVLTCSVDVLMTYKSELYELSVIPLRSASDDGYNAYIADGAQPIEVAKYNEIMNPIGYDSALPDACLNYGSMSLVAAIVGNDEYKDIYVHT